MEEHAHIFNFLDIVDSQTALVHVALALSLLLQKYSFLSPFRPLLNRKMSDSSRQPSHCKLLNV